MNRFQEASGVEIPIICGPMYPCSNPELIAAVSEAGGIGIVQPISLTYVHGYDFVNGIRQIRKLTRKPIGLNVLIEKNSKRYHQKMVRWVELSLQENIRFFITSMGKPDWVVDLVHAAGGIVYHDVTERKWAIKAVDCGVDGLIAVNNSAGGHLGGLSKRVLLDELSDLSLPVVCAGGIGTPDAYRIAMNMGYSGVQMGTRFIATEECHVPDSYKAAILAAGADDIVTTDCISGVPVSVIYTRYIEKLGVKSGFFARLLLGWKSTKYIMRAIYMLTSLKRLKKSVKNSGDMEFWQAGKSVAGIESVCSAEEVVLSFNKSLS